MRITCISASNVEIAREVSASTHACRIVRDLITTRKPDAKVDIVQLIDCELVPCRMCGNCYQTDRCIRDDAFNNLYAQFVSSDAVFVVCPHYALIPAKLVMLLEKLQEMVYLHWCADPAYRFALHQKPIGLIVHGGQTADALPYYKAALLKPLANAFASVQMNVVGAGSEWEQGVAFGVRQIIPPKDSLFVTIEHDWDTIERQIYPLVMNMLSIAD